ncbi:MAG: hypothetical protein AB7V13_01210 [Pseudorhodoplanes sp.]
MRLRTRLDLDELIPGEFAPKIGEHAMKGLSDVGRSGVRDHFLRCRYVVRMCEGIVFIQCAAIRTDCAGRSRHMGHTRAHGFRESEAFHPVAKQKKSRMRIFVR